MTLTHCRRSATLAVAATTLLVGARPAAAAATTQPTFKAIASGTAAFVDQTTTSFAGAGSATRLGRITTDGRAYIFGPDDSCPGGIANLNVETLTDNDGNTLTISSQDVACPTGPGQYHGTGHWTVTGGTGRYAGASGEGAFDGDSDFNLGTFSMTLSGTLAVRG